MKKTLANIPRPFRFPFVGAIPPRLTKEKTMKDLHDYMTVEDGDIDYRKWNNAELLEQYAETEDDQIAEHLKDRGIDIPSARSIAAVFRNFPRA